MVNVNTVNFDKIYEMRDDVENLFTPGCILFWKRLAKGDNKISALVYQPFRKVDVGVKIKFFFISCFILINKKYL